MQKNDQVLYRNFKIALAIGDKTLSGFAKEHNVTHVAIIRVLNQQTTSKNILEKVNSFIDEQFSKPFPLPKAG